jgi:hypothetical protein
MRLTFMNDTGAPMQIHAGSYPPTPPVAELAPTVTAVFELPDDAEPLVKVWRDTVIVLDLKLRGPALANG